ncbi:MAG: hypothetical protein QM784_40015 [Polyangiaceae bacterium]
MNKSRALVALSLALVGCASTESLPDDPGLGAAGGTSLAGSSPGGKGTGGGASNVGGTSSAAVGGATTSTGTGGATVVTTTARGGALGLGGSRTTAAPSCTDKLKNGDETDVDCGGSCETKCAFGKKCAADGDCAVGSCAANVCTTCSNKTLDGDETDVDCGGSCSTKCAETQKCKARSDCSTYNCDTTAGVCGPQVNCLATIPTECSCATQATKGVINPGGDVTYCEAYVKCFLENDCKPTDTCATSNDGVCGVNKVGGGSSPGKGAAAVYTCACGT